MGDITEKEYSTLDLQESLKYQKITVMCCNTVTCEDYGKEKTVDSEQGPHDFIHAKEVVDEHVTIMKNMPIKWVCPSCMTKMAQVSAELFKINEKEKKFSFSAPKAVGDRGKDYYRDFSKQSWKSDPEAGQNATKMSKKDINRLNSL